MSRSTSGKSTDIAAIKIIRWEMIQWLRRLYNCAKVVSDAVCNFFPNTTNEMHMAMNILKVGSSPYYHFRSTLYTAKATDAVKLFGPRLRRRKAVQLSNLAGR